MTWPLPSRRKPEPARDFRDQAVEEALRKVVADYRPDRTLPPRLKRIAIIAVLAVATSAAFWTVVHVSTPKGSRKAPASKPIPVQLVPPPVAR